MRAARLFLYIGWRCLPWLLLGGLTACSPSLSENQPPPAPLYTVPEDGLAEVARYSYSRPQHGVMTTGTATLIIVREYLSKSSLAKTQKLKGRMPVIKIALSKTMSSMNWDVHENVAMYSRTNLRPARLAITSAGWCGNSYLEWIARGDEVTLLGRPSTEDVGRSTSQMAIKAGYYLYEQLPVLVRALAKDHQSLTVRLMAPQSAALLPHANELQVELQRTGVEKVKTAAGEFSTVVVTVTSQTASDYFTRPERYWLDEQQHFIVKAERNEVSAHAGKITVDPAIYELQDLRRARYWEIPLPPLTNQRDDRWRATYSSWMRLNVAMSMATKEKQPLKIDELKKLFAKPSWPAEFMSDPRGNNNVVTSYTGKGGWWFNQPAGMFELNYPANAKLPAPSR